MHPSLLFATMYYGLILAGIASVPGLIALALTLATSRAASTIKQIRPGPRTYLWVLVHGFARRVCEVLLSTSCGLLGAGLFSVFLNVLLLIIAVIWDSVSPVADPAVDMTLVGLLYFAGLSVPFLGCFAVAMSALAKWLKPLM
jgi:hypothetical protein